MDGKHHTVSTHLALSVLPSELSTELSVAL